MFSTQTAESQLKESGGTDSADIGADGEVSLRDLKEQLAEKAAKEQLLQAQVL